MFEFLNFVLIMVWHKNEEYSFIIIESLSMHLDVVEFIKLCFIIIFINPFITSILPNIYL